LAQISLDVVDLLHKKAKMFLVNPSHLAVQFTASTIFHFLGGYACCALHCTFSCI